MIEAYRRQWPRIGVGLVIALGIALALGGRRLRASRLLAALNWGALLLHQYEEYVKPGTFPGHMNRGLFGSAHPDRFPLNTQSAMVVNTILGYPFYLVPIVLARPRWLGIAPALFGIGQAIAHGIAFPRIARVSYSPGAITALLLHVPLGVAYLCALGKEERVTRRDWILGGAYGAIFGAAAIAGPILASGDEDSPHRFTEDQVGPYRD